MTVVLQCQRPDSEFQNRPGGSSLLNFGSASLSEALAFRCSKAVFIKAWLYRDSMSGAFQDCRRHPDIDRRQLEPPYLCLDYPERNRHLGHLEAERYADHLP